VHKRLEGIEGLLRERKGVGGGRKEEKEKGEDRKHGYSRLAEKKKKKKKAKKKKKPTKSPNNNTPAGRTHIQIHKPRHNHTNIGKKNSERPEKPHQADKKEEK